MIRIPTTRIPGYVPLAEASWDRWLALEAETGIDLLTLTPGLYAGPADSAVVAGSLAAARAGAVGHQILDADAIRVRWPVFQPADDTVAVLDTDAGLLRADLGDRGAPGPGRTTRRRAAVRGARRRLAAGLRRWLRGGIGRQDRRGRRAAGADGRATDARVRQGSQTSARRRTPARPVVQPAAGPSAVRSLGLDGLPIWLRGTGSGMFYGFPWDAERGRKIALHHGGAVVDPDEVDRAVDPTDEAVARSFIRQVMPAMDGPVSRSTVCLYTNAPDDEFVIDRHPAAPGVAFASACSGHGFKFAPIVGEILADLAMAGTTAWDIVLFRFAAVPAD